ncbi:hypothetical protein ACTHQY_08955 [Rhodococcoides corynebacterioides]|uniref:hypothetical protein n=1 Tax=Rhodococcoides corynebacterioides TaxID=53972 RepID=UPI003F7E48FD
MAKKQIRVALWEYETDSGERARAYFGDVVDLSASEIERAEKAGVFGAPDDEPGLLLDSGEFDVEAQPAVPNPVTPTGVAGQRPKLTAPKPAWEAYGASLKIDVSDLTKDEIIAEVDKLGR